MSKLNYVNGQIEGIVYRYVNNAEGDEHGWSYVGNTMDEKTRRRSWNNHGNKSYAGKKLLEAREKYGQDSFTYEVLEKIYETDEKKLQAKLNEREEYYIKQFDSKEHGYNSSEGGTGNKGVDFSASHRQRIGLASRGRIHTEGTKAKISSARKGHEVNEETREKISKGNKGKKRTEQQNKAQSNRMKGKSPAEATKKAKEWVKENGGGYWKNHTIPESAKAHMKATQQANGTKVKAIFKDGTEKEYTTMLDCAKDLKIGVGSVHYYLNAGSGNFHKKGFRLEKINLKNRK